MSDSKKRKQAKREARARKQAAQAAADFKSTGKSKYALKAKRDASKNPNSPFYDKKA